MLLDEPTQGMSAEDVSTVTDLIKRVVEGVWETLGALPQSSD